MRPGESSLSHLPRHPSARPILPWNNDRAGFLMAAISVSIELFRDTCTPSQLLSSTNVEIGVQLVSERGRLSFGPSHSRSWLIFRGHLRPLALFFVRKVWHWSFGCSSTRHLYDGD